MDWLLAFIGGVLIGLSAVVLLLCNGRIAGISGIVHLMVTRQGLWPWLFAAGMIAGSSMYEYGIATAATPVSRFMPWVMIVAGVISGFGARMGGGCTSGHGVCGLGRLSLRSLVAVLTFMATAIITVWVIRHSGWFAP